MKALLEGLRRWSQPVSDDDIPDAAQRTLRAARLFSGLIMVLMVPAAGTDMLLGGPPTVLVAAAGSIACLALVNALSRRMSEHGEWLVLAVGMVIVGFIASSEVGVPTAERIHLHYFAVVPLASAALTPLRPLAVTAGALMGAAVMLVSTPGMHATARASAGTIEYVLLFAVLASIAAQYRRIQAAEIGRMSRQRLASAEKMAQVGRMTAGIAHELKTPVAAASSSIGSAQRLVEELSESIGHADVTDDDLREIAAELGSALQLADSSAGRIARFISAIREQTRSFEQLEHVTFAPRERIAHVALLLSHRIKHESVSMEVHAAPDILLSGDPGKFDQVVTNLVANAMDAIRESQIGSKVTVSLRSAGARDVELRVSDDGPGIPTSIQRRVFEPMFTTRGDDEGTGLGLAICRDIVESAFHGSIELHSKPGEGATFVVRMPLEGAMGRATRPFQPIFRTPSLAERTKRDREPLNPGARRPLP